MTATETIYTTRNINGTPVPAIIAPGGWAWDVVGPTPSGTLPFPTTPPKIPETGLAPTTINNYAGQDLSRSSSFGATVNGKVEEVHPTKKDQETVKPTNTVGPLTATSIAAQRTTVTGEGGAVVTYEETQYPEYSTLTESLFGQTITATGDDDSATMIPIPLVVPVGSGGKGWKPVGKLPHGIPHIPVPIKPPRPVGPPSGDVESDEEENTEDDKTDEDSDEECTQTYTASDASILCTIFTQTNAQAKRAEHTECSTSILATKTGCEVLVGTTTTSTTSEQPTPTRELCRPETCGSSEEQCDAVQLRLGLIKRADDVPLPNVGEKHKLDWIDPSHYKGDRRSFMRGGL